MKTTVATETKRIGHTTYIYNRYDGIVGEIKGPYRPGSVWKLETYNVNEKFNQAWDTGLLTPVQRDEIGPQGDKVIAAMCFGQTNAISSTLLIGHPTCVGYLYKTKRAAVARFNEI